MKKIITGVKPTGSSMHLGNLMGAVLPFRDVTQGNDASIFIADLHALTSVKNGDTMREQSFELAIEYFSIFGLDTDVTIFRQSDIVNISKLMWILANVTPYSLMLRAHSFKDFENKEKEYQDTMKAKFEEIIDKNIELEEVRDLYNSDNEKHQKLARDFVALKSEVEFYKFLDNYKDAPSLNMGTFNYPILMAADILGYGIDAVPVGKDQIQHLEMTRDMARNFNKIYGDIFVEPEAIIAESVATLPGIDGRKMSKSYDNFIGIFDDEKILKKRIMSIVSGSEGVDEKKKNPDECTIFNLYSVFANEAQITEMRTKYESENIGFGYGHAKTMLLEVLLDFLRPYREAREMLLQNPEIVEQKLAEWAKKMNARLDEMMKKVLQATGVH